MSEHDITAPDMLLTTDEFYDFVDAREQDERWELVRGIPVMGPSESIPNIDATVLLTHVFLSELPISEWLVLAHADVRLTSGPRSTVRNPDACLARYTGAPVKYLDASRVELVAEAVSRSSVERDLLTKRHEYAAAGIPNYLLINPRHYSEPLTLLTAPVGGDYTESTSGDSVTVTVDSYVVTVNAADLRLG